MGAGPAVLPSTPPQPIPSPPGLRSGDGIGTVPVSLPKTLGQGLVGPFAPKCHHCGSGGDTERPQWSGGGRGRDRSSSSPTGCGCEAAGPSRAAGRELGRKYRETGRSRTEGGFDAGKRSQSHSVSLVVPSPVCRCQRSPLAAPRPPRLPPNRSLFCKIKGFGPQPPKSRQPPSYVPRARAARAPRCGARCVGTGTSYVVTGRCGCSHSAAGS